MIDTSVLIDYFRKTDKSRTLLVELADRYESLCISSITEYEIYTGATPTQLPFWNELLGAMEVFAFDSKAARKAVNIQNDLKKRRKTIDKADLFIAATAVVNGLTLETLNRKHFDKIERLVLRETRGA